MEFFEKDYAFKSTMQAWNDESYTDIHFEYQSLNSSRIERNPIVNSLLDANDEEDKLSGIFTCSNGGVLATGGYWYSLQSLKTFRNKSFHNIEQVEKKILSYDVLFYLLLDFREMW